ncbi:MAG: YHS domain-containing protein [Gemmatimonadetes bacterium]|nr:YHS domain-containing protein [Gemmatimonadota bacterium]MBT8403103.1 YHS domain-containing protein [Gemmatimonadota bacterium]NNF12666.1 YHS domain-containing protein [Gemmatimonadota bacterium]NNK63955.1 YHS domain-containing protein [Gemmatimonadota bacterium]
MKLHDEVCGMEIEAKDAEATVEFQDETYHFCSERCARKFREHPDWYVPVRSDRE